jgi:hypothetical protein
MSFVFDYELVTRSAVSLTIVTALKRGIAHIYKDSYFDV